MNSEARIIDCQDCGRRTKNRGRHLCTACYQKHRKAGSLIDFDRASRPADELLEDWQMLRDGGYSVRNAAARMGVTHAALSRALARAKRRGDPRGSRVPYAHDMTRAA